MNLQEIVSLISSSDTADFPNDSVIYIPFNYDINFMQKLWDKISLTPLEDAVLRIIKESIEPRLIRLDISSGTAKVRLEGESKPLPISVLGDGVQRVLFIALALVNAKHELDGREGKIILIDELESGLHHSVQEKLWNLIFEYAKKWQIQFFITTHNQDTLNTFYYVANEVQNQDEAFLFRLQYSRTGKLEVIPYDVDRLENVLEMNIDIR
jgi:AAA15 family ATPase/GTPase